MKPFRELDALVAEHVMGWNVPLPELCSHGLFCLEHGGFPHYSTDIAAAWEVFEYFMKQGKHVVVGSYLANDTKKQKIVTVWAAKISLIGEEGTHYTGTSAPHAICLAALKAIGLDGVELPT